MMMAAQVVGWLAVFSKEGSTFWAQNIAEQ